MTFRALALCQSFLNVSWFIHPNLVENSEERPLSVSLDRRFSQLVMLSRGSEKNPFP